ncbi:aminotransferase class V [Fadolivirus algeromassiliense]|jgi:selenocysteine lyase/cysteine desulfurase|uniref:NifS-like protein n=1 Tax=Fadolivirus FV1/VV64 TaxID=3070911 RepID=A0A7D3V7A2_9VIRU|nr:aminotransferase class V [Fadolivirus algeromassiliense]QKF93576.1 aminotransferase class V [Fadolivirus FV1/VV64]
MDLNIIDLPTSILDTIILKPPKIKTPFKNDIPIIFADSIASGRPSPLIEKDIYDNVLPYYSNTHSNAYCGIMMKNLVNDTKTYIRKSLNIDKSKKIIFTGSGTTCAINHLVYCLKLELLKSVNIFVTPIEHHSNYLPWVELSKKYNHIKLHVIPVDDNFNLDTNFLEIKVKESNKETINIVSITACSNVLGIKTNIQLIYDILQKYNTCECSYGKKNLLFVDYACSAPYVKIDGNISDALFFSPHKFLGGTGTPGVLIANKELFHNQSPFTPGGGCVKKVCSKFIEYEKDIEKREMAGTPNIIGIIKIKKVLELKNTFINTIEHNEHEIAKYIFCQFNKMSQKYNNIKVILPKCNVENRLPIVCISCDNIHYNLVVALLSDLFGIQTRGGVSCTGILAELIQKRFNISGWCRISFHWLMKKTEIDYIIESVEYILDHINDYKDKYEYNKEANLFTYIG